jgi:hypothetical protein
MLRNVAKGKAKMDVSLLKQKLLNMKNERYADTESNLQNYLKPIAKEYGLKVLSYPAWHNFLIYLFFLSVVK